MTQAAVPDSADWQRRWTIEAGRVTPYWDVVPLTHAEFV